MATDTDVIPLSRFAVLGKARGSKRMNQILAQADASAQVAAMPVQDLYYLIKEVGLEDARELVALATPDQMQGFLDLEVWQGDRFLPAAAVPWLSALVAAGPERLTEVWRQLDQELTSLTLATCTRIYSLAEEEVPDDEEPPFFPTPDRFFMIKITAEDPDHIHLIERLLDSLYRVDAVLARHTIRSAASEPLSYLEEQSGRFRQGRMQDLGYADYYEALEVYRPVDLTKVLIGEGTQDVLPASTLPAILADQTVRAGFLGRVLGQITSAQEGRRLEAALVTLVNRVLSADRVSPADPEAAARGAARGAATLSLGLEAVARGELEKGVLALASISLTRLHRVGHTVLVQLGKLLSPFLPYRFDEPLPQIAAALRKIRPVFPGVLDGSMTDRPFGSLADVERVTQAISAAALALRAVREVVRQDPITQGIQGTIGDIGRTALVHFALGEPLSAEPITMSQLLAFVKAGCPSQGSDSAFGREFSAVARGWSADLQRLFGELDPTSAPDQRFLEGLLFAHEHGRS